MASFPPIRISNPFHSPSCVDRDIDSFGNKWAGCTVKNPVVAGRYSLIPGLIAAFSSFIGINTDSMAYPVSLATW
jgi:hypothetical protein